MPGQVPTPRRGTRPRNRRELILAAAVNLFGSDGYHKVGMSTLAEAVGIGPSALYRHFSSKEAVLETVVADGLDSVRDLVVNLDLEHQDAATALAGYTLDHRHLGVLWQREARDLSQDAHQRLRETIREIGAGLTRYVRSVRPELSDRAADLLAW